MVPGEEEVRESGDQWKSGDRRALGALLDEHLSWISERVHHRLGEKLRRKEETCDLVQDALVQFLRYGPRIVLSDGRQFRALLARIAENVLRDKHDWFTAQRRAIARERPLPSDTLLNLDLPRSKIETPSKAAARNEREGWVRLGVELLEPADRELIVMRDWQKLEFSLIGEKLTISGDAARMRYRTALCKLSAKVGALRRGKIVEVVDED